MITKLSPLALINPFTHELESVTSLFGLCGWFLVLFGCCFLCLFVGAFVALLLFLFVLLCCHRDSTQDYVSVLYQFTFEATQPQMVYVCHN